jgi:hypothetical protein
MIYNIINFNYKNRAWYFSRLRCDKQEVLNFLLKEKTASITKKLNILDEMFREAIMEFVKPNCISRNAHFHFARYNCMPCWLMWLLLLFFYIKMSFALVFVNMHTEQISIKKTKRNIIVLNKRKVP